MQGKRDERRGAQRPRPGLHQDVVKHAPYVGQLGVCLRKEAQFPERNKAQMPPLEHVGYVAGLHGRRDLGDDSMRGALCDAPPVVREYGVAHVVGGRVGRGRLLVARGMRVLRRVSREQFQERVGLRQCVDVR